ncbi:MAG TPA: hypothetical protein VNI01_15260 [Elusimicrobiota bacterium]|nr:hypothetical protein [Elusimicrobiota bacterium]
MRTLHRLAAPLSLALILAPEAPAWAAVLQGRAAAGTPAAVPTFAPAFGAPAGAFALPTELSLTTLSARTAEPSVSAPTDATSAAPILGAAPRIGAAPAALEPATPVAVEMAAAPILGAAPRIGAAAPAALGPASAPASALPSPARALGAVAPSGLPAALDAFFDSSRGRAGAEDRPGVPVSGDARGPALAALAAPEARVLAVVGSHDDGERRRLSLRVYEASIPRPASGWRAAAGAARIALGFAALGYLVWVGPLAGPLWALAAHVGAPAGLAALNAAPWLMFLRGVLAVETVGYAYHRFFQHVGFMTRTVQLIRRNQKFHWIHHMIIYPIGRLYRRDRAYVPAETPPPWVQRLRGPAALLKPLVEQGLSWVVPALLAQTLAFAVFGFSWGALAFVAAIAFHAKLLDYVHSRFHEVRHLWTGWRYFQWLEDIHLLHHWDQRFNFTILVPLMDMLFGTWSSPRSHRAEIAASKEDALLTVSDFINWRYLLTEATPAERAAFISNAKAHADSMNKVARLLETLDWRIADRPEDAEARELRARALALLGEIDRPLARELLARYR